MKTNILHITNGDQTTHQLKKSHYTGTMITWREMLCEGKTTPDVGSEGFWKSRFDFLSSTYQITKQFFIDHTIKEFRSLCQEKKQDEIVLWFEYDLYSQVNMLAVISWLKKHRNNVAISLVCAEKGENPAQYVALSALNKTELALLFENRVSLNLDDIEYADYIWQLYCSESPLKLQNVQPSDTFKYLEKAIQTHLLRYPTIKNGLNHIENTILKTVVKEDIITAPVLMNNLIKNQAIYGFGALQFKHKIHQLKGLFTSLTPISLNDLGIDVFQKKQNYYPSIKDSATYLGGSLKYGYLYNEIDGKLLKL